MNFGCSEDAGDASRKRVEETIDRALSSDLEEIPLPDSAETPRSLSPPSPRGVVRKASVEGARRLEGGAEQGSRSADLLERDSGRKKSRTAEAMDLDSFAAGGATDASRCVPPKVVVTFCP